MGLFRRSKATQQNGQAARGDEKEVKMSPNKKGDDERAEASAERPVEPVHNGTHKTTTPESPHHVKKDQPAAAGQRDETLPCEKESKKEEKVRKDDGREKSSYANVTSVSGKGRRGERTIDDSHSGDSKQTRPWNFVVSNKPWRPLSREDGEKNDATPERGRTEARSRREDARHKRDGSVTSNTQSPKAPTARPSATPKDEPKAPPVAPAGQPTPPAPPHTTAKQDVEKVDSGKSVEFRKQVTESTSTGQTGPSTSTEAARSTEDLDNNALEVSSLKGQESEASDRSLQKNSFSARRNESSRGQDKAHSFRNTESTRKYESREQDYGKYAEGEQQESSKKPVAYESRYQRGKFKKQSEFRQRYRSESPRNDYRSALKKNLEGSKTVNRTFDTDVKRDDVENGEQGSTKDSKSTLDEPTHSGPQTLETKSDGPTHSVDPVTHSDETKHGSDDGSSSSASNHAEDVKGDVALDHSTDDDLSEAKVDHRLQPEDGRPEGAQGLTMNGQDDAKNDDPAEDERKKNDEDKENGEDFPRAKDFTYKSPEFKRSTRDRNMDLVHQDAAGDSSTVQDYKSRITKGKPFYPPKHSREDGVVVSPTSNVATSNVYVHHDGYKPSEGGSRRKRSGALPSGDFDGHASVNPYLTKHAEYTYYPVDPQEYTQYATLQPMDAAYGVQYLRSLPGHFSTNISQGYLKESQDSGLQGEDGQSVEQTAYSGQVVYNGQSTLNRPKIKPRKNAALQILNPETGEVVNSDPPKEQRKTPKPPENTQTSTWQYNPYLATYAQQAHTYLRPQYAPPELVTNAYYYLPHEISDAGGFTMDDGVPLDGIQMPMHFPLQRRASIESRGSLGSVGHKSLVQGASSNSGSVDGGASDLSPDGNDASKALMITSKYAQLMQNQHSLMAGQYAAYRDAHVRIKNKPIAPTESIFTLSEHHPLSTRSTGRKKTKIANEPLPEHERTSDHSEHPTDGISQKEYATIREPPYHYGSTDSQESLAEHPSALHSTVPSTHEGKPELPTVDEVTSPEDDDLPSGTTDDDHPSTEDGESIDSLLRFAFSMKICAPEELGFFKFVPLNYQIESPREQKVTRAKKKKSEKWRSDPPPELKKVKMTKEEQFTRTVRTLLNKLTVEKFLTVGEKVALVYQELDSPVLVDILVRLLHEKATTEIDYSDMYADLALLLKYKFNDVLDIGFRSTCFQRTLLNRCQDAFEEISRTCKGQSEESANTEDDPLFPSKNWVLGNIRFMGELFLRKILSIAILKRIFGTLLCRDQVPSEHLMECFTELLTTIGFTMEKIPGGPEMLDEYMKVLQGLRTSGVYSTRISFKIQDLMDLRTKNWKKKLFREKATTVDEIHTQAKVEELKGGSIYAEQEGRFTTAGLRADRHYTAHLQTLREQAQSLLVDGVYKGPQNGQAQPKTVTPPSSATVEQKKADVWEDVLEIFMRRPSRGVFVDEWKKIGVEENDKPRVFRLMCQKATYASTLEVSCALAELAALVITALTESQATLHKLIDTLSIQFLERLQDEMLDNPRALLIFSRILIALFCECSNRKELLEMLIFPQDEQLAQELAQEVVKGVKERNGDVSFTKQVIDKVCKIEV